AACLDHRLFRVVEEIDQDLLHLVEVEQGGGQGRVQLLEDLNLPGAQMIALQAEGLLDDGVQIQDLLLGYVAASERQKVSDDLGHSLGLAGDRQQLLPDGA